MTTLCSFWASSVKTSCIIVDENQFCKIFFCSWLWIVSILLPSYFCKSEKEPFLSHLGHNLDSNHFPFFWHPSTWMNIQTLWSSLAVLCFSFFSLSPNKTLCSRNFQNVKLRLDFVEIWSFYCHSDFLWNPISANSYSPKMSFLAILEVLNFEF